MIARIQISPDEFIEIRRAVEVANPSVTLSASVSESGGSNLVDVRASSPYGISGVSATLDGAPFGTLAQPNACSATCGGIADVFRFVVDAATVATGPHAMDIVATDFAGSSRQASVAIPPANANAAVLSVTSPVDGAFVSGTLTLAGTYTATPVGPVTVTANLGDLRILQSTAAAFSTSFDLTGPADSTVDTGTLLVQRVTGGAAGPVSSTMTAFHLRDGVLAWLESVGTGRNLKASTTTASRTLSTQDSAGLLGTGGGTVVYREGTRLYSWSASTDATTLRSEAVPEQTLVTASHLYFVIGDTQSLYRLPLDP